MFMEFFDVVRERRSVRTFLDLPVDKDSIYKILDSANQAPSSGNLDNWQFIVVEAEKDRFELASACHGQFWIKEAPVHIIVLSDTERVKRVYGNRGEFFAIQNVSAAIQNMLLACEDLDLAACWVGSFDEKWIKRAFSVPDNIDVHAVIVLGPKGAKPPKPKRSDVSSKVYFERYGKKTNW